ncbi:hypothetical protein MMC25_003367 [Agyrium rufum]|nr:hypothetical protein [Agyrium rufum]
MEELESRIGPLGETLSAMHAKVLSLERDMHVITLRFPSFDLTFLPDLSSHVTEVNDGLPVLESRVQDVERGLPVLENQVNELLVGMHMQETNQENERNRLEGDKNALESRLTVMDESLTDVRSMVGILEPHVEGMSGHLTKIEGALATGHINRQDTQEKVDGLRTKLAEKFTELQGAIDKLSTAKAQPITSTIFTPQKIIELASESSDEDMEDIKGKKPGRQTPAPVKKQGTPVYQYHRGDPASAFSFSGLLASIDQKPSEFHTKAQNPSPQSMFKSPTQAPKPVMTSNPFNPKAKPIFVTPPKQNPQISGLPTTSQPMQTVAPPSCVITTPSSEHRWEYTKETEDQKSANTAFIHTIGKRFETKMNALIDGFSGSDFFETREVPTEIEWAVLFALLQEADHLHYWLNDLHQKGFEDPIKRFYELTAIGDHWKGDKEAPLTQIMMKLLRTQKLMGEKGEAWPKMENTQKLLRWVQQQRRKFQHYAPHKASPAPRKSSMAISGIADA